MSEHPYWTIEMREAISAAMTACARSVTAGMLDKPQDAYDAMMDIYVELDEATSAMWNSMFVTCPECDGKSAVDQTDTCPLCGPHMGCIPRHQFARVDPIWQDPAPVVVCPVCDGECDTIVDGYAKPCPACDGIGRMQKEDAILAAYQIEDETETTQETE
jgi:RecJ-like exonuclease